MQFIDLKAQYQALKEEIDQAIQGVLDHGQYIMGKDVVEFEEQLSAYTGMKHVITCGNGTDALQMIFMAYDIGDGDAVFCPDVTFIASIEPACMLGATPVFCDITADTYNLCPVSLEKQIQQVLQKGLHKPKAVVAVDMLGNPADYEKISQICKKYDLLLIEDAAQSFGACYQGDPCTTLGDVAITSFFPAKPLGCYGDGGAIFTNNDEIAEVLRSIRVHGKGSSKYDNVRIGMNSRLDTMQAAILKVKFKAFKEYEIEARQQVANRYNESFAEKFVTPFVAENCKSVYAQYVLLAKDRAARDHMIEQLTEQGIPNMVYYPNPQHRLKVFEGNPYLDADFTNAEHYCDTTFSLPMHPYLTVAEQDEVIAKVLEG